jgi:hypothetical protein
MTAEEEATTKAGAPAGEAAGEDAAVAPAAPGPEEATTPEAASEPDAAPASEPDAAPTAGDLPPPSAGLDEVRSWSGTKLDEMNGATVGRIEGAYVAAEGSTPEWLVVKLGRFGHHTLVPARDAVAGAGHVWVPFGRDAIREAPRLKPGAELTRRRETELLVHYGIGGAGRAAEIAEGDADDVTSRPAG